MYLDLHVNIYLFYLCLYFRLLYLVLIVSEHLKVYDSTHNQTHHSLFQVRAQSDFTKKETEVFLQYVHDYRLERQLTALYNRLMGVSALTNQPTLLEELILTHKPKRWELKEFCVKVGERAQHGFFQQGSLKLHPLLFYKSLYRSMLACLTTAVGCLR